MFLKQKAGKKRGGKAACQVSARFTEVSGLQPVDTSLHFLWINTPGFFLFLSLHSITTAQVTWMNLSSHVIKKQKTIKCFLQFQELNYCTPMWALRLCVCVLESLLWCSCVRQTERVINYKPNGSCRSVSVCSDPFTYLTFASLVSL